jgi:hypothetical protein
MNFAIKVLFKIYNFISTNFEKAVLLKEKKKSFFLETGFEFIKLNTDHHLQNHVEKKVSANQYFERLILKKNSIKEVLKLIFLKYQISNYITHITGYNFSIDFVLAYSTAHIEKENQDKSIYANLWHRDKPYSQNTLKLIMPLNIIGNNSGPMQIINKNLSSKYTDDTVNQFKDINHIEVIGDTKTVFLFNPNICFHRAGIPNKGVIRSQLMLQLNPSKNWNYSSNLYEKQFKIEPKFPLLKIFEKKITLCE